MKTDLVKVAGLIAKVDAHDDGTIDVWGWASSEVVDSDGEIVLADAMREAIPDYMRFGAVREMHQAIAAGTALEIEVKDDGRTWFGAHVVDPVAVLKVTENVYKAFSIGAKVLQRNKTNRRIIERIHLVEVSLVDRPANPEAVFELVKGEPMPEGDTITKSLYHVGWAADLLASLNALANDKEWEAALNGADAATVGRLKALVAEFASALVELTAEEAAAVAGEATGEQPADEVAASDDAAKTSDDGPRLALAVLERIAKADVERESALAKAGKKFSAATRDVLAAAHKCVRDADAAMASIGYESDADDDGDKTERVDLAKAADAAKAEAAESKATLDAARAELTKAEGERDELRKRVADLEAAAKTKGATKAVPVEKSADVDGDASPTVAKSTVDLIKAAHRSGGVRVR
jgi:hypothetical protein